jgi:transcriptional regulator with XRE-family HTH domain
LPFCKIKLHATRPKSAAYPKEIKTLGDHLRKKRLDLGLLQEQVAAQIGVDEATIWNWENNITATAIRLIPRITHFLTYDPFPVAESLAEKLKTARRRLGISQKKLAEELGVDPASVRDWERGRHKPTSKSVGKIEKFLSGVRYD